MASITEVITTWTPVSGVQTKSVMYFGPGVTISQMRNAVAVLWAGVRDSLTNTTLYTIEPTARVLDDTTGALLGSVTDPAPLVASGEEAGEAVADATQVLLRWQTGVVVGRRFLQGRQFVPGLARVHVIGGNLEPATAALIQGAQADFLAAAGGTFGVWHRPTAGAGGRFVPATTGSCWNELAVLRRRRNR